jgi:MFS family permease
MPAPQDQSPAPKGEAAPPTVPPPLGGSPFAPLRVPAFREIWIANVISNIGGWMQSAGAGWEMAGIAPSPMFVAGMAIATTCPVFLFGFPAGVLADRVDRRLYIVCCQVWMMLASIALTVLAWTGNLTAWNLLALTLCMGIGNAVNGPAWHAVVPEIVPRPVLPAAIALNSAGFNLARTIGPVIGQVLHGFFGVVVLFAVNSTTFLAIIFAMLSGRRRIRRATPAATSERRSEGFWQGFMSGVLYVRTERSLWRVWARGACFFVPACGFLTLLPHFALHDMNIDAATYGMVFASFGVGAVGGSLSIPWVNRLLGMDRANIIGMLLSAACCVVAAQVATPLVVGIALALAGACWMVVIANNQVTVQSIIPGWVRARAMSVHQMVFFGSLAIGQTIWGLVADQIGVVWTMTTAAVVLVGTTALAAMIRLPRARLHISTS